MPHVGIPAHITLSKTYFPAKFLGPLIPTTLSYINANFIEHYFDVTVVSLTNDATKHEFDDGDDSE